MTKPSSSGPPQRNPSRPRLHSVIRPDPGYTDPGYMPRPWLDGGTMLFSRM